MVTETNQIETKKKDLREKKDRALIIFSTMSCRLTHVSEATEVENKAEKNFLKTLKQIINILLNTKVKEKNLENSHRKTISPNM